MKKLFELAVWTHPLSAWVLRLLLPTQNRILHIFIIKKNYCPLLLFTKHKISKMKERGGDFYTLKYLTLDSIFKKEKKGGVFLQPRQSQYQQIALWLSGGFIL